MTSPGAWRTFFAACTLCAVASCTRLLDFDQPDGGTSDANYSDGAPAADDASADLYEPNDTPETAKPIEPGDYELSIYPRGDQDYWQLVLGATADVIIDLSITGGADLDLELYSINALDAPIAWSRSATDHERILRTTEENGQLGPGVFIIRVFAFVDHSTATYTLSLSVEE